MQAASRLEADNLYLSRIYSKLRVAGCDEAVARVRDLGREGELMTPAPVPASAT